MNALNLDKLSHVAALFNFEEIYPSQTIYDLLVFEVGIDEKVLEDMGNRLQAYWGPKWEAYSLIIDWDEASNQQEKESLKEKIINLLKESDKELIKA